jgi:hypothetical protein
MEIILESDPQGGGGQGWIAFKRVGLKIRKIFDLEHFQLLKSVKPFKLNQF